MTDLISHQPDEILIKIFLLVGYQTSLCFVSNKFRRITQIMDIQQIQNLNNIITMNANEQVKIKPIILINNYLADTYILGPIYNYYNFNIIDIRDTLRDIELIKKLELCRVIKNKFKMSIDDINKILNLTINNINLSPISIVKMIYQQFFELSCMLYLIVDDFIWIVNYIINTITSDDIKMITISQLPPHKFLMLSSDDYQFYHRELINNIKHAIKNKTIFIYNNKTILHKKLNEIYNMIKKSKNFNYHLYILKMI
jgi:hypothetical protein